MLPFLEKNFNLRIVLINPGRVTLIQRPTIPHIVNGISIPDNNLKWKKEFVYFVKRGDCGTLFRSSFGQLVDGSPSDITLTLVEQTAFNALNADNGWTHSCDLPRETVVVEHGLSPISQKGNSYSFFFLPIVIIH